MAQTKGSFHDMSSMDGKHYNSTWSFRLKYFGTITDDTVISQEDEKNNKRGDNKRFGYRTTRSVKKEREALALLKDLFIPLGGNVDLKNPDVSILLFEGLGDGDEKILTRKVADGPKVSIINPNTRHCVTNTPLCPTTSYIICNLDRIKSHSTILDPYAGSCSLLLASSLIESETTTVGIEIANENGINRTNIMTDFYSRDLTPPKSLLCGDFRNETIRDMARESIGNVPFDVILTDPPYGIREKQEWTLSSSNYPWSLCHTNPLLDIVKIVAMDLERGKPLICLNGGGRLVVFVPCTSQQSIYDLLPAREQLSDAMLSLEVMVEQRLNDSLSRWLVVFESK
eukprot:15366154-Ditylum_brightwellii.AAC.1